MKKLSIEYVKNYFLERGYTPLFDEYVGNKISLKIMCPKKHIVYMSFNNFKQGHRCRICDDIGSVSRLNKYSFDQKYTTDYVKNYFIEKGYIPLFDEYINSSIVMKTKCPNSHIYYTNFNNFKNKGYRCSKCFYESRRYSLSYVRNYFLSKDYIPLFSIYTNSKVLLKTECPNGHIYYVSFSGFKNYNRRCPICSGRKKHTIDYVKFYFIERGYTPFFDKYINKNSPLKVMCPVGHVVNMSFSSFRNKGSRCVVCYRQSLIGAGHPRWKGGISCEPYCSAWLDENYKNSIRERDSFKCQNPYCYHTTEHLNIHHIDYNKKNCGPENLITVCAGCNSRANTDREWHTKWYQTIMNHRYGYKYE